MSPRKSTPAKPLGVPPAAADAAAAEAAGEPAAAAAAPAGEPPAAAATSAAESTGVSTQASDTPAAATDAGASGAAAAEPVAAEQWPAIRLAVKKTAGAAGKPPPPAQRGRGRPKKGMRLTKSGTPDKRYKQVYLSSKLSSSAVSSSKSGPAPDVRRRLTSKWIRILEESYAAHVKEAGVHDEMVPSTALAVWTAMHPTCIVSPAELAQPADYPRPLRCSLLLWQALSTKMDIPVSRIQKWFRGKIKLEMELKREQRRVDSAFGRGKRRTKKCAHISPSPMVRALCSSQPLQRLHHQVMSHQRDEMRAEWTGSHHPFRSRPPQNWPNRCIAGTPLPERTGPPLRAAAAIQRP